MSKNEGAEDDIKNRKVRKYLSLCSEYELFDQSYNLHGSKRTENGSKIIYLIKYEQ